MMPCLSRLFSLATLLCLLTAGPAEAVEMLSLKGGEFLMGSPKTEFRHGKDETLHRVRVSAFQLAAREVTQKEYREVMGTNPSHFQNEALPVENLTWLEAVAFCNALSKREGLQAAYEISGSTVRWNREATGYRLPTEAEWEYACRAGSRTPFNTGEDITDRQANFYAHYPYRNERSGRGGQYRQTTLKPGTFAANTWGFFDMHGNVWEWCWDWYAPYTAEEAENPAGPDSGQFRVSRGGGWNDFARHLRSAYRAPVMPENRSQNTGLRLARNAE